MKILAQYPFLDIPSQSHNFAVLKKCCERILWSYKRMATSEMSLSLSELLQGDGNFSRVVFRAEGTPA